MDAQTSGQGLGSCGAAQRRRWRYRGARIPALLVSERRRLLKFLSEEQELHIKLEGDAQESFGRALTASAARYAQIASMTKHEKVRRQALFAFVPSYVGCLLGIALVFVAAFSEVSTTEEGWLKACGYGSIFLSALVMFVMVFRVNVARRDESAEARKLAEKDKEIAELKTTEAELEGDLLIAVENMDDAQRRAFEGRSKKYRLVV